MDYGKEKKDYKEEENRPEYQIKVKKPEEPVRSLPTLREMVEDIPISGSIASVPILHKDTIFFTSLDTHAYAVNANTGDMIWKFKTGDRTSTGCLVHKDRVYFASFDGHLYCTDLDGKLMWKKYLGDFVFSPATGIDDKIFIGNGEGTVFCLSIDGEEIWNFKTGESIAAFPVASNGLVFVPSYDKCFYALDMDGKLRWKFIAGERCSSPVIMSKGKSVFSCTDRSWDRMPRAENSFIYFGSYDNNLYCLSMDGDIVWKFNCGSSVPGGIGGDNGTIYAGTITGRLFAIDALKGEKKWDFLTGGTVTGGAEVSKGKVYFTSFDHRMYCFSEKGEKLWDFMTGGPLVCRPLVTDKRIYFGSSDTFLYCLNIEERAVEWTFQAGFGLPDAIKQLKTKVSNALVEYDRKVFKVWKPETSRAGGEAPTLQGYAGPKAPEGFDFGGMMSYSTKTPYLSKSKYLSDKGPYNK